MAPSGHRRNLQPKSSYEIFIRAVLAIVVSISLVGPNTAVFGVMSYYPKGEGSMFDMDFLKYDCHIADLWYSNPNQPVRTFQVCDLSRPDLTRGSSE